MQFGDIAFRNSFVEDEHPRFRAFRPLLSKVSPTFHDYPEVFERLVAEKGILTGKLVKLVLEPTGPEFETDDPVSQLVGVNDFAGPRVAKIAELLSLYESQGAREFWRSRGYEQGLYFKEKLERDKDTRRIKRSIKGILFMYERMKAANDLVPKAKLKACDDALDPTDIPWSINYLGYRRRRDGAHRRAVAHFLGWSGVPVLEFQFERVTPDFLADNSEFVRRNFASFSDAIYGARQGPAWPLVAE